MNTLRAVEAAAVCGVILFFAGCECPKMAREKHLSKQKEEVKPTALSVFTQEVSRPAEVEKPGVKPEAKTVPEKQGRATPYEVEKAAKDEPIPPRKIAAEKVFKSPGEISRELALLFKNIHFDFDRYDIRDVDVPTLTKIGNHLLANPSMEVLIEGHCDERGTREYNLVLGEQRALSTRRFLVGLGVSPKRLYTVSYGEDMPADPRSNEEAWAKNRRAEFKIAD